MPFALAGEIRKRYISHGRRLVTLTMLAIGYGRMGRAIVNRVADRRPDDVVTVLEISPQGREDARSRGIAAVASLDAITADFDLVLVATKPQQISAAAAALTGVPITARLILSVAAGVDLATLRRLFGPAPAIVRAMPNLPATIGCGITAYQADAPLAPPAQAALEAVLDLLGDTVSIDDERQFDAITAISGSGPAYLFYFIECLTSAGVALGLPISVAAHLARATVYGASRLANDNTRNPADLRRDVTSPGGTTAAALDVLMAGDRLVHLIREAALAAVHRSATLGTTAGIARAGG